MRVKGALGYSGVGVGVGLVSGREGTGVGVRGRGRAGEEGPGLQDMSYGLNE